MIKISEDLVSLAKEFNEPLYLVGGAVRDYFLGYDANDYDICSSLDAGVVRAVAEKLGYKAIDVNKKLGTLLIVSTHGEKYEYTQFRVENYVKGHSPSDVEFVKDIKLDAARRDFTINSIYYNILTGEIYDPYNGIKDAKQKVVKCVETPEKVFSSDGLRILRFVRFVSMLNFKSHVKTFKLAKKMTYMLKDISGERKWKELEMLVRADERHNLKTNKFIKMFNKLKIYKNLLLLPNNFRIKLNSDFKAFLSLDFDKRMAGFFVLLLLNKYEYKYYPGEHMANDARYILSNVLKASNLDTKQIIKIFSVVQDLKFKPISPFIAVNYHALTDFERKVVNVFINVKPISVYILNLKNAGIPLSEKALALSNEEIGEIVGEKRISLVRRKLFELCLFGKLKNEKQSLINFLKLNK